jgi:hypothetical protein
VRQREAGLTVGVGRPGPQAKGTFVVVMGFGEPVDLGGRSRCGDGRPKSPRVVTDDRPVVGQFGARPAERAGIWVFGECIATAVCSLMRSPGSSSA